MKHLNFSRLFDNKSFCKTFSVIGAIVIWAAVTLTAKTDSERILRNVPIDFSVAGTAVEALGLNEESAPAAEAEKDAEEEKNTQKSRVGRMFDLLTFDEI